MTGGDLLSIEDMHERAEALRANRQLLVASHLGEQEVDASSAPST
jgi:hypothetical protein